MKVVKRNEQSIKSCLYLFVGTTFISFMLFLISNNAVGESPSRKSDIYMDNLKFRFLDVPALESVGGLWSIAQDIDGYIWIGGSKGLARYDGYDFKIFRQSKEALNGLHSSYVNDILIDSSGKQWVVTGDGVYRYDSQLEKFKKIEHDSNEHDIRWLNITWDIEEGVDGSVFIASDSGFYQIDSRNQVVEYYRRESKKELHLNDRLITKLLWDSQNNLWVGTKSSGLNYFNLAQKKLIPVFQEYKLGEIRDILEDVSGTVWFATYDGLYRTDEKKRMLKEYKNRSGDDGSLSSDLVQTIFEDSKGRIFIGTDGGGLNLYNPTEDNFIRFGKRDGLFNLKVRTIFEDSSGEVWFGHFPYGVSVLDEELSNFSNYKNDPLNENSLSGNDILSVVEDDSGNLWVGTDGQGINYLDREANIITRYMHHDLTSGLSSNVILSIHVGAKGDVYAGSWRGGLDVFNKRLNTFVPFSERYDIDLSGIGREIWAIYENDDGIVWVGSEVGLTRINKRSSLVKKFRYRLGEKDGIHEGPVTRIVADRNNNLWLGGYNGVTYYDQSRDEFTNYRHEDSSSLGLGSNKIVDIFPGDDERIWISTSDKGVYILDRIKGSFSNISMDEGMPSNSIAGINMDNEGMYWFGSVFGLVKYDSGTNDVRHYTTDNGLPGNLSKRPILVKLRSGEFAYGTTRGLSIFDPLRLKSNTFKPPVVLTDFQLFNSSVSVGGDSIIQKAVNHNDRIILSHKHSVFSFEFSSLSFKVPEKNQYKYMLEGFDETWNPTSSRRVATYTNLNPGEYLFKIRGSNNDGVWSDNKEIALIIKPAWWDTWWAYTIYAVSILGFLFWVYYLQRQKILHQNMTLKKLRRLDQLKNDFLANTSHELRTPLHGMIGLAESLIDGAAGPLSKEVRRNLSMIAQSGMRLGNLVDDILDFSKLKSRAVKVDLRSISLFDIVDLVASITQPLVGRKNILLKNNVREDLPAILADEDRLQQIFYNIIGNSIKFTSEGYIVVDADQISDAEILVSVTDSGIGIPKEKLGSVFESFEQVEGAENRDYGGTGIGLTITKQLIELQGGDIWVESDVGKGTVFKFKLPISENKAEENVDKETYKLNRYLRSLKDYSEEGELIEALEMRNNHKIDEALTILIVDDEPVNCQVLVNHLSPLEYNLVSVLSGAEALEIIENGEKVDLVILDVMMPKMSGYDVCREIRKLYSSNELPVLLLTAKSMVSDLVVGFNVGANDFVSKPITKEELLARVNTHLDLLLINRDLDEKVVEKTEALRLEHENLKNTQSKLVQSESMASVGTMVAGIAHEINNPANYAMISAYNMLDDLNSFKEEMTALVGNKLGAELTPIFTERFQQLNSHVEILNNGVNKIQSLVENLHVFSRPEDAENIETDVKEVIELCLDVAKGCSYAQIDFEFDAEKVPRVFANPALLNQAFMAILQNACQAIEQKQKSEEAFFRDKIVVKLASQGNKIVVEFSDSGCGMDESVVEHMFNPFYSGWATIDRTGLGLSIAYDIIEKHNGDVSVNSAVKKGTTVKVILPEISESDYKSEDALFC